MASSGTFYKTVGGGGYRLQGEWSSTQNISNNTTTVSLEMFWISLDSYHTVNSSASKSGKTTIDGTSDTTTGLSAKLSARQKKKLGPTQTKTITHNSDGTKSITLGISFDAEVTLEGTYYGTISHTDDVTLNTIPRASTLDSSASFTAGNNINIDIDRKSSSFTHTVRLLVNGVSIKADTDVGASKTMTFTDTEKENIFKQLAQGASKGCEIEVTTYKGGTKIGSTYSKTGTCTAPRASTVTASTFNVGASVGIGISRANSDFTHKLVASIGSYSTTLTSNATTSYTWNTSGVSANLLAQMPTNSRDMTITCTTYYGATQVRTPEPFTVTAKVTGANPTFTTFTYADTASGVQTILGNPNPIVLVRNKSNLKVTIPVANKATAATGATMVEYIVTVNKTEEKGAWSNTADVVIDLKTVDSATNVLVTVKAVDSRKNSTPVSKTVLVADYLPPKVVPDPVRQNSFDVATDIKVSGSWSPVVIGGVTKNTMSSLQYRTKPTGTSTWSGYSNITYTTSGGTYSGTAVAQLDQTLSYDLEVRLVDKFTGASGVVASKVIPAGRPIFFIDSVRKSIGVNALPTQNEALEVNRIVLSANSWATANGGGIDMQNSDIVGVNGIWISTDVANNDGEGMLFLKPGRPSNSKDTNDYNTFRILDGVVYLDSVPIAVDSNTALWSGAAYLESGQTVTPTKKLSECPNGWVLAWSDYDYGSGTNDFQWVYSVIHKGATKEFTGGMNSFFLIPNFSTTGSDTYITKTATVYDNRLTGLAINTERPGTTKQGGGWDGSQDRTDVVLRRVYAF